MSTNNACAWAKNDVVAVVEHHRPGKDASSAKGAKVHGGVARVVSVDEVAQTADLHFYLEGRRAKNIEWAQLRTTSGPSPATGESESPSETLNPTVAEIVSGSGDGVNQSVEAGGNSELMESGAAVVPSPTRTKAVERYDPETGMVLEEYASGTVCAQKLGLTANEVSDAVRGKGKKTLPHALRFKFGMPSAPVSRGRKLQGGYSSSSVGGEGDGGQGITHEERAALDAATLVLAGSKRSRKPAQAIEVHTGPTTQRGPRQSGGKAGAKGSAKGKGSSSSGGGSGGAGNSTGSTSEAPLFSEVARLPAMDRNNKAFKPGKWRKEAFGIREYDRLSDYEIARSYKPLFAGKGSGKGSGSSRGSGKGASRVAAAVASPISPSPSRSSTGSGIGTGSSSGSGSGSAHRGVQSSAASASLAGSANVSNLNGLYFVPSTAAERQRATAATLRTTLSKGKHDAQLIGQPYNDEAIVEQYIQQEIVDFRWGQAEPGEPARPDGRRRHVLMKDLETLEALFQPELAHSSAHQERLQGGATSAAAKKASSQKKKKEDNTMAPESKVSSPTAASSDSSCGGSDITTSSSSSSSASSASSTSSSSAASAVIAPPPPTADSATKKKARTPTERAALAKAAAEAQELALEAAIEDSLVRSLVASRLDGMLQEVASRAVEETGALLQAPLKLRESNEEDPAPVAVAASTTDSAAVTSTASGASAGGEGAAVSTAIPAADPTASSHNSSPSIAAGDATIGADAPLASAGAAIANENGSNDNAAATAAATASVAPSAAAPADATAVKTSTPAEAHAQAQDTEDADAPAADAPPLREQPVWGLDAYTRHNIRLALEDDAAFQALVRPLDGVDGSSGIAGESDAGGDAETAEQEAKDAAVELGVSGGAGGALGGGVTHGVAIAAFCADPKQPLQLSVALGDTFVVLDRSSSHEWRVRNEHTGQEGWVPPPCIDTQEHWAVTLFVEHALLPAINRLPSPKAHNLNFALDALLAQSNRKVKGVETDNNRMVDDDDDDDTASSSSSSSGSSIASLPNKAAQFGCPRPLALCAARAVRQAIDSRGGLHRCSEDFRVHPKGTGVVVDCPEGLPAHTFVNEYIGELYPPWRWFERQDAVAQAQKALAMPPSLPDFYNIVLERPSGDSRDGYGLVYVDASKRANFSSSLSHSCTPNCEPRMATRQGRLCIVLVTLRATSFGEELTFDYGAVTTSVEEYRLAICLCGTSLCRQSFLDFVASDSTQQLLNRWHSPADRFAMLFDASVSQFRSQATRIETDELLRAHGFALGSEDSSSTSSSSSSSSAASSGTSSSLTTTTTTDAPPPPAAPFWLRRFVAKCLKDFVDKERVYLPIQLKLDGVSAQAANQEARSLIEQRIQSLVGTLSSVGHVFDRQVAVRSSRLAAERAAAEKQARKEELRAARAASAAKKKEMALAERMEAQMQMQAQMTHPQMQTQPQLGASVSSSRPLAPSLPNAPPPPLLVEALAEQAPKTAEPGMVSDKEAGNSMEVVAEEVAVPSLPMEVAIPVPAMPMEVAIPVVPTLPGFTQQATAVAPPPLPAPPPAGSTSVVAIPSTTPPATEGAASTTAASPAAIVVADVATPSSSALHAPTLPMPISSQLTTAATATAQALEPMPVPAQEAPAPVPGPAPATTAAATAAASTTAPTPKAPTAGAKKAAVNPSSTPSYPVEPPAPLRVVGPAETWEKLWLGQNSLVRKLQQAVAAEEERIYAEFVAAVPVAQAKAAAAARAVKTASKTTASYVSGSNGSASILSTSAAGGAGAGAIVDSSSALTVAAPPAALPSDKALKSAMKQAEALATQCAAAKAAVDDSLSWRIAPKLSALLGDGHPQNNHIGAGSGAGSSSGLTALVVRDAASCKEALLTVRNLFLEASHSTKARLPKASRSRYRAAADCLLLWAHTRTFAVATQYEVVESDPTPVFARDLGGPLTVAALRSAHAIMAQEQQQQAAKMSTPSICSTAGSAITGTTSTGGGAAGSVTTPRKITATNGSSSSSSSSNKKARTSKESNSNASGCAAGEAAASVSSGGEKSAKQRAKGGPLDLSDIPMDIPPLPRDPPNNSHESSTKLLSDGTQPCRYKGVRRAVRHRQDMGERFQVSIGCRGFNYYLGGFDNEYDAGVAYARAQRKLFGPSAPSSSSSFPSNEPLAPSSSSSSSLPSTSVNVPFMPSSALSPSSHFPSSTGVSQSPTKRKAAAAAAATTTQSTTATGAGSNSSTFDQFSDSDLAASFAALTAAANAVTEAAAAAGGQQENLSAPSSALSSLATIAAEAAASAALATADNATPAVLTPLPPPDLALGTNNSTSVEPSVVVPSLPTTSLPSSSTIAEVATEGNPTGESPTKRAKRNNHSGKVTETTDSNDGGNDGHYEIDALKSSELALSSATLETDVVLPPAHVVSAPNNSLSLPFPPTSTSAASAGAAKTGPASRKSSSSRSSNNSNTGSGGGGGSNSSAVGPMPLSSAVVGSAIAAKEGEDLAVTGAVEISGNEVVYHHVAKYGRYFVLGRLMDWFNLDEGSGSSQNQGSGGGGKHNASEMGATLPFDSLFGCVLLPPPAKCFASSGPSASSSSSSSLAASTSLAVAGGATYEQGERAALLAHLNDKNDRRSPWPAKLSDAFGGIAAMREVIDDGDDEVLLGSPVVDFLQGSYKGLSEVLQVLQNELGIEIDDLENDDNGGAGAGAATVGGAGGGSSGGQGKKNAGSKAKKGSVAAGGGGGHLRTSNTQASVVDESAQQDNEQSWAQCEACDKWRRVPWYVDAATLDGDANGAFTCKSAAAWGDGQTTCDSPEEDYDALTERVTTVAGATIEHFELGMEMDTYCLINKAWYEAKVVKIDSGLGTGGGKAAIATVPTTAPSPTARVLVHFKGWGKSADEWVLTDSERLRPHRLHTCGTDYKAEVANLLKGDGSASKGGSSSSGGSGNGKRGRSKESKVGRPKATTKLPAKKAATKEVLASPTASIPAPGAPEGRGSSAAKTAIRGKCETCNANIDCSYGSGRFCNQRCRSKWNGQQSKNYVRNKDAGNK